MICIYIFFFLKKNEGKNQKLKQNRKKEKSMRYIKTIIRTKARIN